MGLCLHLIDSRERLCIIFAFKFFSLSRFFMLNPILNTSVNNDEETLFESNYPCFKWKRFNLNLMKMMFCLCNKHVTLFIWNQKDFFEFLSSLRPLIKFEKKTFWMNHEQKSKKNQEMFSGLISYLFLHLFTKFLKMIIFFCSSHQEFISYTLFIDCLVFLLLLLTITI